MNLGENRVWGLKGSVGPFLTIIKQETLALYIYAFRSEDEGLSVFINSHNVKAFPSNIGVGMFPNIVVG